jgi:hypothetical protein
MLEGLFSPLHLLLLIFIALIIFGIPLLLVFLLARWLDKRLQRRPGVRVSIVSIVIGGITDVVASTVLALPVVIYVMVKYDLLHSAKGPAAIASTIHSSAGLYGLQLGIGLACSVLGGYVAAWMAKHDELLNGLLSSFLCTVIGIYSVLSGKDSQSVLVQIFLLAAAPAFALLGGYLRQTQKRMGGTPGILGPSPEVH